MNENTNNQFYEAVRKFDQYVEKYEDARHKKAIYLDYVHEALRFAEKECCVEVYEALEQLREVIEVAFELESRMIAIMDALVAKTVSSLTGEADTAEG